MRNFEYKTYKKLSENDTVDTKSFIKLFKKIPEKRVCQELSELSISGKIHFFERPNGDVIDIEHNPSFILDGAALKEFETENERRSETYRRIWTPAIISIIAVFANIILTVFF